jgi:hypothetical protein
MNKYLTDNEKKKQKAKQLERDINAVTFNSVARAIKKNSSGRRKIGER